MLLLKFSGQADAAIDGPTTSFLADLGAYATAPTISTAQAYPVGAAFVANTLTARAAALGAGEEIEVTLLRNGLDTGLTLTLTSALLTDTISTPEPYEAGDTFDLRTESSAAADVPIVVTVQ